MPGKDLRNFFLSIVFPSILAITLFILSIFVVIIPSFENSIMEEKKAMISELTNTAWSLLEEFDQEYRNGNFTLEEAQKMAGSRIEQIRYGNELKDYFWIIDGHPKMIIHPYRLELRNTDLTDYKDPNGKKLFVEATKIVEQRGEGFIDYMWQWKDDSSRIVPKLSFVKGFEPWGWIVGTGIYLEDVREEIRVLKNRLLLISLVITLIITTILLFVIKQSLSIENQRKDAESKLMLSKQKYKSLVEASTEGTLMMLNGNIIFSNNKFNRLIGYDASYVMSIKFDDIFKVKWEKIIASIDDPKKSVSIETKIKCKDNIKKEVVLSISEVQYDKAKGYIIVTKEVTQKQQIEKETEHLTEDLQVSLMLMNQPISSFINDILKCSIDTTIREAAKLMTKKRRNILFVHRENDIVGAINNSDLKKRVLAENIDPERSVMEIMTAPVVCISENALLYEAILLLKNEKVSHLATKDDEGKVLGVIGYEDLVGIQQNAVSYLIREIEGANDVGKISKIHNRVPILVNALVISGDKTQNITRIITSVSDAIVHRVIDLIIEDMGPPPCEFAFMVMGSEGRMEQTLSTDQDNAIVYIPNGKMNLDDVSAYFLSLGKKVSLHLDTIGYRLCNGEIMASNPKWTQPLEVWKGYFSEWVNTSDPQSILDACIFFDFRYVYGTKSIVDELRLHVNIATENKSVFFYHLAQSIIKYKPPLSLFGNIVGKNNSSDHVNLDIKKTLLPIMGFVRLYALFSKIDETNTLRRLRKLYTEQVLSKSIFDEIVLSYNYLMQMRFRSQSSKILSNIPPDNIIDIKNITHIEAATLKKIFGEINNLQTKLSFDFKGSM